MATMSVAYAKSFVAAYGMTLKVTEDGEFRVNYARGKEATAYYTNDITDAVNTALNMADEAQAPKHP